MKKTTVIQDTKSITPQHQLQTTIEAAKPRGSQGYVLAILTLFILTALSSTAQIKLPRLVSDGMVLQRDKPVKIWGWATAGEKVTVRFNNKVYYTTTNEAGQWQLLVQPTKSGGPYNMEIAATNTITLNNILMGDVWVCSGQSNMDLPMARVAWKYPEEMANAGNPQIRQFLIATRYNFQAPQDDLPGGAWEALTKESIGRFTAAGYFFAKSLYEKYQVPIGLIKAPVGGSPVEAWLSEEALQAFPAQLSVAQKWKDDNLVKQTIQRDRETDINWYTKVWQGDAGLHESKPWSDAAYDDAQWPTMNIPGYWDEQGYRNIYGTMWFRKSIEVPASMTGKPAKLLLGTMINRDSVYINGLFVGTTGYQYPPRRYEVPAGILKAGNNTITIRLFNSSGRGGFTKDKDYLLATPGDTIQLTGAWKYKQGASAEAMAGSTTFQYQPGGLFNGMIAPITPYAIKGVIWYQGEANASRAKEYQQLFPALISNWRQQWQQGDFSFLYVQLANFMATKPQPAESQWAELREAQLQSLSVPNTAMAVIIDAGEWNDIHPLNKKAVGQRLSLAAQRVAYGNKKLVYSGPLYQSMQVEGNKIRIKFSNTGSGLIAKDGKPLQQFAIAGADKKFVWAHAIIKGKEVIVWSEAVVNPVAVRYAWADNPEGANLYNKEGLPASPFRTGE